MEYISKLNLDSIDEKIYFEMYYYLFKRKGIDDSKHIEKLEKLLQGELVERVNNVSSYFDELQKQIENNEDEFSIIPTIINNSTKDESLILKLIKKIYKK